MNDSVLIFGSWRRFWYLPFRIFNVFLEKMLRAICGALFEIVMIHVRFEVLLG